MACPNLTSDLLPYLGNEMVGPERLVFEEHLATCASCAQAIEIHRHNVSLVRSLNEEAAPESLRVKIRTQLLIEDRIAIRKRHVFALGMAAGMSFCALLGYQWHRQVLRQSYEKDAALRHARQFPLEIRDGQNIEAWFVGTFDHPVMIPQFPGVVLAGARLLQVRDKPAAYIRYDGARQVGLFIFGDDHDMGIDEDVPEVSLSNGFHVVSWRQGDLVYQLVSDLDERKLMTEIVPARHRLFPQGATIHTNGAVINTVQPANYQR
jgi:anti-sigma factor RsiW